MNKRQKLRKKILFELLDFPLIPFSIPISIKLWKKLCLKKRDLGIELGYYDFDDEY